MMNPGIKDLWVASLRSGDAAHKSVKGSLARLYHETSNEPWESLFLPGRYGILDEKVFKWAGLTSDTLIVIDDIHDTPWNFQDVWEYSIDIITREIEKQL